jgi:nitrite reductase/ring-hydroxylating ferredoxin subunit
MGEFMTVGEARHCPAGGQTCVEYEGRKVAAFNVDGALLAVDDECSHAGASLSAGRVDGTVVTCPGHGATFDPTTGDSMSPPASGAVRSYDVRIEGGEIPLAPRD